MAYTKLNLKNGTKLNENHLAHMEEGIANAQAGGGGGYYTPNVTSTGVLSWTPSNSGMAAVPSTNIRGPKGDTGESTRIREITASVDDNVGTPSVVVTQSGTNTIRSFNFAFANLKGEKGDTGANGAQGPKGDTGETGAKGADGYTPVKGVDYFTPADQEEIVQQVIAALGTPVFGTVDENNNIILTGDLASGTYTVKYEDAEGNLTEIGTFDYGEVGPSYTNVIPLSTDVNGNPYNGGLGYREGYRYSSSGGGDTAGDGLSVTGYIQCKDTDTLYFKNVGMNKDAGVSNGCNIYKFNTLSATSSESADATIMTNYYSAQWDSSGNIVSMTCGNSPTGATVWMRFNTTYLGPDSIITLNQPITD